MLKDGVCQTEVAFGVLEIDGVDLVGHGRGAYFASLDFLFEVFHGDVAPDVAAEVNQNDIEAFAIVEIGSHVVIVFYLCGVLQTLEAEMGGNKIVAETTPVNIGIGGKVGIEIAGCTTEFGRERNLVEIIQLPTQTVNVNHELFAQRCGRCGLAMSVSKHGDVFPLAGTFFKKIGNSLVTRQKFLVVAFHDGKGYGGIVDILRS